MNNKVKFLRGTSGEYAVAEKDSDTIYFTTDDGKLYIGDKEISGSDITIDDTLSDTSTNPVQGNVIKQAIDNKADKTVATTSADGLMSASDKGKLDAFEITTTGGKLHDKDIATADDIPDLSPYAKTADVPDIKVNAAVDADTVGGLNPDVFSKTKIMATDIFGITDQYGKLKLWSASEFKRPICAEFNDLYAIPCPAADSDTFYYYYVVLMNADTHDCIPNTPVSGTIYYIDAREVTT